MADEIKTYISSIDGNFLGDGTVYYLTDDEAVHGLSVSGKVITFTKGDGTSDTITTQDTVTTITTTGEGNAITSITDDNGALTAVKGATFLTEHQSLADYAPLASPALTGTPTAPTAATGTNTTQIATTAFVETEIAAQSVFGASGTNHSKGLVPDPGSTAGTTRFLREDGTWTTVAAEDTKNTAGATDTSSKIYLIGALEQTANPQTYSQDTAYVGADGKLYSDNKVVLTEHQSLAAYATLTNPTFTGIPEAPTAAAGTNTTQIATTAFVKAAIDASGAAADAMRFKGTVGTGGTVSDLPAIHKPGDTYKVKTAGTYAGQTCEVGDMIICVEEGEVAADADWTVIQVNIDGAVIGPASSVDSNFAAFDGVTGKLLKNSSYSASSFAASSHSHAISDVTNLQTALAGKADVATTLAGYGITDASITNGTITLGSNSITPITSHQDISGKADKATTLAGYGITDANITNGTITLGSNSLTPVTSQSLAGYVPTSRTVNGKALTDNISLTAADVGAIGAAQSNNFTAYQTFSANSDVTSETSISGTPAAGSIRVVGGIAATSGIKGSQVYNAVWNDLADCIPVDDEAELEYGYVYCFDGNHYYKSTKYMDDGIIGIHSDTAGFVMGTKNAGKEMQVAVAGFVLAYVDREYKPGTPLTCTCCGMLTEIHKQDKMENPEKVVATYWKPETSEEWGSENKKVVVNGRAWVKVK